MPKHFLSVIIKATWACNMRCLYCYEQSNDYQNKKISTETVYNLLRNLSDYYVNEDNKLNVKFIWHGGEPLLLGRNFYEEVVRIIDHFPTLNVKNTLQTNGTLLNQEWLAFFQRHKFRVGTSLDGPPELHNKQRVFVGMKPSFNEAWENFNLLREIQKGAGVVAVVTRNTLDMREEFYDFFVKHRISVKLSPLIPLKGSNVMDKSLGISPEEYGEFLVYLFERWVKEPEYKFRIDPLFDMVRSLMTGFPQTCTFTGMCDRFLSIEPDGSVTVCGRWSASDMYLGNINSNTMEEIYDTLNKKFLSRRVKVRDKCVACRYFPICHGGCSYLAYSQRHKLDDRDLYCVAYKRIFERIESFFKEEGVAISTVITRHL